MSQLKLRFTAENSVFAATIRWYTWGAWSHVEFALPSGYLGSTNMALPNIPPGVALRPLDYVKADKEIFGTVEVDDPTMRRVLDFAKSQEGKGYDWLAIAGMPLRQDWHTKDAWFCSELVAAAFDAAGYPLVNGKMVDRITPRDIALSPLVKFG